MRFSNKSGMTAVLLLSVFASGALAQKVSPVKKTLPTKNISPARKVRPARKATSANIGSAIAPKTAKGRTTKAGCGDSKVPEATAPKRVGPAPVIVIKQTDIVVDSVWRGQQIECVFTVKNEGEGVLDVRVRGG